MVGPRAVRRHRRRSGRPDRAHPEQAQEIVTASRSRYQRRWTAGYWTATVLTAALATFAVLTQSSVPQTLALVLGTCAAVIGSLMATSLYRASISDPDFDEATSIMRSATLAWCALIAVIVAVMVIAVASGSMSLTPQLIELIDFVATESLLGQIAGLALFLLIVGDGYVKFRKHRRALLSARISTRSPSLSDPARPPERGALPKLVLPLLIALPVLYITTAAGINRLFGCLPALAAPTGPTPAWGLLPPGATCVYETSEGFLVVAPSWAPTLWLASVLLAWWISRRRGRAHTSAAGRARVVLERDS